MTAKDRFYRLQKSTTVRANSLSWMLTVGGIKTLANFLPDTAAKAAAAAFFRTSRIPRIARGPKPDRRLEIQHRGRTIVGSQWGTEGTPMLLVHGWNGHRRQLSSFVEPLVARGHRVFSFDGVGHGESSGTESNAIEMAEDLLAISQLVGPLAGIVAHSLGGPAVVLATLSGLDVERIALISPPVSPDSWISKWAELLGLDSATETQLRGYVAERAGVAAADLNLKKLVPELRAKLLVVHDVDDGDVPFEEGQAVASAAGGRLFQTRGLGHHRILRDPAVIAEVRKFLHPERPALSNPVSHSKQGEMS